MHCIFVSWLWRHSDARQNMSNCLLLPLRTPSCPLDPSLKHCANTQVQHGSAPLNCRLDITHLLKKMMMNTAYIQLYTYTIIHDHTVLGIIWNISGTKEKTTNPNFQSENNTKQLLSNWPRVPKYVKMCLPCACHVPAMCQGSVVKLEAIFELHQAQGAIHEFLGETRVSLSLTLVDPHVTGLGNFIATVIATFIAIPWLTPWMLLLYPLVSRCFWHCPIAGWDARVLKTAWEVKEPSQEVSVVTSSTAQGGGGSFKDRKL